LASETVGVALIFLHKNNILSAPVMDQTVSADKPVREQCLGIVDVIDCK